MPYVLVNPKLCKSSNAVIADDVGVAAAAMEYLFRRGHRKIAYVGPHAIREEHYSAGCRIDGYHKALAGMGLAPPVDFLGYPNFNRDSVLMRQYVQRAVKEAGCTALLAYDYSWTSFAFRACHEMGLHVGQDISLMSCDWAPSLDDAVVPVTSMFIDHTEMGRLATRMLLRRIEDHGVSLPSHVVSYSLVENRSVRDIR